MVGDDNNAVGERSQTNDRGEEKKDGRLISRTKISKILA
jgi:hypothetical protein